MENIIIGLIGGSFGAGLLAIIQAYLQHRWKQKDTHDDGIKAIIAGQKTTMIYIVRQMGQEFISKGSITLSDRETIDEMHSAYKALGGNGHLDTIMAAVDKLPIKESGD